MWLQPPSPVLFKKVIHVVEQSLPSPVTSPRPENQMTDLEQSLAVLQAAVRLKNQKEDVDGAAWPRPEVVDQIQTLMKENQYSIFERGEKRGSRAEDLRPDSRRKQALIFLARGLMDQLFSSVRQELMQINPPDEELHQYFEKKMDPKFKDYLMKLPPEEMQEKLKFMYLSQHLPPELKKKIHQQLEDVKNLIFQQLFRGIDPRSYFLDGPLGRGIKDRAQEMKDRPLNGVRGPGNRGP